MRDAMPTPPTLQNILSHGLEKARQEAGILCLLTVFFGLVATILLAPAIQALESIAILAERASETPDAQLTRIAEMLKEKSGLLIVSLVIVTLAMAVMLVPWARIAAGRPLPPLAGGMPALTKRSVRGFWHLILAWLLSVLAFVIALTIAELTGMLFRPLGMTLFFAGALFALWFSIAINALAHFSLTAEARGRQETLTSSLIRGRLFLRPMTASFAVLFIGLLVVKTLAGTAITVLVPPSVANTLSYVVSFGLWYLATALFIAGTGLIPDLGMILGTGEQDRGH